MKEYKIVEVFDTRHSAYEKLEVAVLAMMEKGWIPLGGIAISTRGDTWEISVAQAMVK
jgi:hypothetical protein